VPILPDDTAFQVFRKVTVAAEIVLARTLPDLVAGSAPRIPQNAAAVTVFGKRRPEDGEIDWSARAKAVHDLIRGVAPPYPGAYTMIDGRRLTIFRTRREPARTASGSGPTMYFEEGACYLRCADGGVLRMLACALDGDAMAPADLERVLGAPSIALPSALSQQRVGTFSRQAAP
jgi:methionyl-tRNA formyltransferase